jgi:hypothetical protein
MLSALPNLRCAERPRFPGGAFLFAVMELRLDGGVILALIEISHDGALPHKSPSPQALAAYLGEGLFVYSNCQTVATKRVGNDRFPTIVVTFGSEEIAFLYIGTGACGWGFKSNRSWLLPSAPCANRAWTLTSWWNACASRCGP